MVPQVRCGLGFFVLFSVVVTASVQLVGVYVVFASLILPALAVNGTLQSRPAQAIVSRTMGIVFGLGISMLADLPTGPTLVFSLVAVAVFVRAVRAWRYEGV